MSVAAVLGSEPAKALLAIDAPEGLRSLLRREVGKMVAALRTYRDHPWVITHDQQVGYDDQGTINKKIRWGYNTG